MAVLVEVVAAVSLVGLAATEALAGQKTLTKSVPAAMVALVGRAATAAPVAVVLVDPASRSTEVQHP